MLTAGESAVARTDEGTPYARLSAANCGAQPARTLEELEKADARLRENTQKILDKK
jgi:hypothetical protein